MHMADDTLARRVPLEAPFGRQLSSSGSARGTALSAIAHAALIAFIFWAGRQQFVDASRRVGDDTRRGGGGGGGGARAVAVFASLAGAAPAPPPKVETPPLVVPETPTIIPEVQPRAEEPVVAPPATVPAPGPGEGAGNGTGAGPGSGTGTGGGTGGGVGTGVGNDSGPGGGEGGDYFQPQPQGVILPPQGPPRNLRGVAIRVIFQINERGQVVEVRTEPVIADRSYRNEFLDRMRRYTFTPAYTRNRQPIAAEFPITITL